ncbi:unnamed protein product [Nesidiocoris tenuis]|uniref:Uncharacterized protein n=1 Tax=Nesidiocoris tenuis TaxID=355587 RepID=A0A6H5GFF7_9HEMI|nr:unnamed protein product [Nesidiocoris tenuis]
MRLTSAIIAMLAIVSPAIAELTFVDGTYRGLTVAIDPTVPKENCHMILANLETLKRRRFSRGARIPFASSAMLNAWMRFPTISEALRPKKLRFRLNCRQFSQFRRMRFQRRCES